MSRSQNEIRGEEKHNLVGGPTSSDFPPINQSGTFGQPVGPSPSVPPVNFNNNPAPSYPFYNIRKYRDYYDVDTKDVLWRVGNSMIGCIRPTFMEVTLSSPDLYGPFWAATTLIFLTSVVGTYSSYVEHKKETTSSTSSKTITKQWYNDYTKLATSAGVFYGYIFIVSLAFFFTLKYLKGHFRLINVICIYGYSLTIFIPVCILCIIPFDWLRWALVMGATAISGASLGLNLRAAVADVAPKRAFILMLCVVLLHIGLGLALKFYFFKF
mmetsp:Transcript_26602/g.48846  ORF Transcript_26602/g.48846 Transcript_26602/m.48846 type:complete len:269 (+) Transcript_26602:131-937(+)